MRDRIAWVNSNDGIYTVKTGYRMWCDSNSSWHENTHSAGWTKLWYLKIPHKMRMFLWRVCRNNVLVHNMLIGKGVNVTIMCPMCNMDVEHLLYIFFDCRFALDCWKVMNMTYDMREAISVPNWLL